MKSLRNHRVFYVLGDSELEVIMNTMFFCENSQQYIFQ